MACSGSSSRIDYQCVATLDAYCAQAGNCLRHWTDFTTNVNVACGRSAAIILSNSPCGGYDTAGVAGDTQNEVYYFSHDTGLLVAVVQSSAALGGKQCVGGPGAFSVVSCSTPVTELGCPDAGGGLPDATAAD